MLSRSLIEITDNIIDINENNINLFEYFDKSKIPAWEPKSKLPDYSSLTRVYFDIETTGGVLNGDKVLDKIQWNRDKDVEDIFKTVFKKSSTDKDKFILASIRKYLKGTIKPFDEMLLSYGNNPVDHEIVLIGLMNEAGKPVIINCRESKISTDEARKLLSKNSEVTQNILDGLTIVNAGNEKKGLERFIKFLNDKLPDILTGFNIFKFDLPFIIKRCELLGIKHPFYTNFKRWTCHKTAQKFGEPQTYRGIWFNRKDKKETAIIDLYNQVLSWDFVSRKLTRYSLKQSCLQTGLRKTQRTELTFPEMLECIDKGSLEPLTEYLVYDLEDTKLLGDFLIPAIYYQKMFLPDWKLQSISHSGNGSKWNDIIKKYYFQTLKWIESNLPETDDKHWFTGGLAGANAGVFRNVSKIDVASLYPSIMLTYGIYSLKDSNIILLAILKYLKEWRLRLKAKKANGTASNEEIQCEAAFKVMINSAYGCLAVMGINFNDYMSASLVTAYGRKILKLMCQKIVDNGGRIVSIDTDGCYYSTDDDTFVKNLEIYEIVQNSMPNGIDLDYELEAKLFFVPPKEAKKIEKQILSDVEDVVNDGLKKNYVIISWKKQPKGQKLDRVNAPLVIKSKGRFVKRDRCKFEKDCQPEMLLKLTEEGLEGLENYYEKIKAELESFSYPIDSLKITRKVRVGEKKICKYGEPGEVVSYYRGYDIPTFHKRTGKQNKKGIENWIIEGEYNNQFYINLLDKMYGEIKKYL